MKKRIMLTAMLPLLFASCINLGGKDVKELQQQVAQLQKDVEELKQVNGLTSQPYGESTSDSTATKTTTKKESATKKGTTTQQRSESIDKDKEQAMEAIRYCLRMYEPTWKYNNMRVIKKANGSFDVIVDYTSGVFDHNYTVVYAVTLYGGGAFKITDYHGHLGHIPYYEKLIIGQ